MASMTGFVRSLLTMRTERGEMPLVTRLPCAAAFRSVGFREARVEGKRKREGKVWIGWTGYGQRVEEVE